MIAASGGGHGFADEGEQFGVIAVHERRHVAQTVVDHVRLRSELRVRTMTDKLRDRKTAVGDILIKSSIRQGALRRDKVHIRFALHALAQLTKLRYDLACDRKFSFGLEINLGSVLDVQLVEDGTNFAPDPRLLRRVINNRRAEPL